VRPREIAVPGLAAGDSPQPRARSCRRVASIPHRTSPPRACGKAVCCHRVGLETQSTLRGSETVRTGGTQLDLSPTRSCRVRPGQRRLLAGDEGAPRAGFEPALTAPEAVALSPELTGLYDGERLPGVKVRCVTHCRSGGPRNPARIRHASHMIVAAQAGRTRQPSRTYTRESSDLESSAGVVGVRPGSLAP
jgi:hypothetical protein